VASTRDRILDESLRLFAERGFDGTAVTDIEEASGLVPGSGGFYRHFKTKEAVLTAVVDRAIEDIQKGQILRDETLAAAPVVDLEPHSVPEIAALIESALAGLHDRRLLAGLLARIHGRFPDLEARIYDAMVAGSVAQATVGTIPFGDDPASQAEVAVVLSALSGYHLSLEFYGRQIGGLAPTEFAEALAKLITRSGATG